MKYLLLTYGGRGPLTEAIPETGERVAGASLADPALACTLRVSAGTVLDSADGPFSGAHEQVTGFWLVDCETMDRALALAASLPGAGTAAVEVRPLMEQRGMEM